MATASELWNDLVRRRARKPLTVSLPEPGNNPVFAPGSAASGYFQVRLSEMFLRDGRQLFQEIAPATLCVFEFKYGGQPVRVPFFVSNKLLAGLEAGGANLQKARVQFKDTRVVGPVPYVGDEVGVFTGLFRTVLQDSRKTLFSVFEKLLGTPYTSALVPYVQLADKISDDLVRCLGVDDVSCILAERRPYATQEQPLGTGYVALLNCADNEVNAAQLSVQNGGLRLGGASFDQCDYCLMRFETMENRDDYTTLPFHRVWKEAQRKLLSGQVPEAKAALLECQAAVLACDDLTEDHKYRLIEFYQGMFLKDQDRFDLARAGAPGGEAAGRSRGGVDAQMQLVNLAKRRDREPKAIQASIDRIRDLYDAPMQQPEDDAQWQGAILEHLAVRDATPRVTPDRLAQTLTAAMIP